MRWSKRKVPNRKEVNPPIDKHFTGSMTGAEELLKREPKPKSYKVSPTATPIEQRVFAITQSETLKWATNTPFIKQPILNAHCIILKEPQPYEDAKQAMRDYLTEEFADERILIITLEEE